MRLDTPRLIVRDLQSSDAAPLAAVWADPDVTRFMGGPRNGQAIRAALEEDARSGLQAEIDLRPVIEKASGEVVGHCGLIEKDVVEEFGGFGGHGVAV